MDGKNWSWARGRRPLAVVVLSLVAGCNGPWPKRGTDDVTLTIGHPSVYTRERFISDRFEDIQWLEDQLGKSEYEQGFQGRLQLLSRDQTGFALKAVIDKVAGLSLAPAQPAADEATDGDAGGDTDGQDESAAGGDDDGDADGGSTGPGTPAAGGTKPPATAISLADLQGLLTALSAQDLGAADLDKLGSFKPDVTPVDRLNDRLAFRDAVRDRIRQHALDDVHDLSGSALYELHFGLGVSTGADAGQPHIIVLTPRLPEAPDGSLKARLADVLCNKAIEAGLATKQRCESGTATPFDPTKLAEGDVRGRLAAKLFGLSEAQVLVHASTTQADLDVTDARKPLVAKLADINTFLKLAPDQSLRKAALEAATWTPAAELAELSRRIDAAELALAELEQAVGKEAEAAVNQDPPLDKLSPALEELIRATRETYGSACETGDFCTTGTPSLAESQDVHTFAWDPSPLADPSGIGLPPQPTPPAPPLVSSAPPPPHGSNPLSQLRATIQSPPRQHLRECTGIALGFMAMQSVAEKSGHLIACGRLIEGTADSAETWIPQVKAGAATDAEFQALLGSLSKLVRVIAISPAQEVEQHLTSSQGEIRRALDLAISGQLASSVAAGIDFQKMHEELRRYELVARNPLVVGLINAGSHADNIPQSSFGWLVAPRLQTTVADTAELRYRHLDAHHSVTVTIIVPAYLRKLTFDVSVYRVESGGAWKVETERVTVTSGGLDERTGGKFDVELPGDLVSLADGLLYQADPRTSRPKLVGIVGTGAAPGANSLDPTPLLRVGAEDKAEFVLQGKNLWRNPEVFVGGQRADDVRILPDLAGLAVRLKSVTKPAGQTDKPVRVDLLVSTSQGTDVMKDVIEVYPKKADAKAPVATLVWPVVLAPKSGNQVDLAFLLDPPLPPAWSQVRLRINPIGSPQTYFNDAITNAQTIVGDKGARLGARGIPLDKFLDTEKRQRVAVDAWLVASPLAEPVRLTKESQELLILRQPLELALAAGTQQIAVLPDADPKKPVKVKPKVEGLVAEAPAGLSSARLAELLAAKRVEAGKPPATTFEASNSPGVMLEVIVGEMPARVRIKLPEGLEFSGINFDAAGVGKTDLALVVEDVSFTLKELTLKKTP